MAMTGLPDIGGGSWMDLASAAITAAGNVYTGIQQQKAAKKAAKASAGVGGFYGGFMPAMGFSGAMPQPLYMGQPVNSGVMVPAMPGGFGAEAGGSSTAPAVYSPAYGGGGGGGGIQYQTVVTRTGRMAVVGWRSLGRPLLWSGDLAAVKRVARVARKLGRGRRHPR